MSDKKNNLDLALRKNKGARIRDQWLHELESIIRVKLPHDALISLEETEILKAKTDKKLIDDVEIAKMEWPSNAEVRMYDFLTSRANRFDNNTVCLFSSVDNIIGAVRVPLQSILLNAKDVWKLVQNDIKLLDARMDGGICLEKNFYSITGTYVAEEIFLLSSWGTLKIEKCDL